MPGKAQNPEIGKFYQILSQISGQQVKCLVRFAGEPTEYVAIPTLRSNLTTDYDETVEFEVLAPADQAGFISRKISEIAALSIE